MKTEYQNSIILKLKRLREERGFSQYYLSTILGISTGQIGNIESFKQPHKYTLRQIMTLCKLFKVDIASLFIDEKTSENVKSQIERTILKIIEYEEKNQK